MIGNMALPFMGLGASAEATEMKDKRARPRSHPEVEPQMARGTGEIDDQQVPTSNEED